MEASALPAPSGLARTRISIGAPVLRLRSDEQLVALFRAGHDEAFRVIHDRYRQRLFAYARQMLPESRQDAEDALQDVFVRAYGGLRANDRELALRAWLYRVAHNRCIDELRRPAPPAPEVLELVRSPVSDPIATAEQRESLRRLIADVRRLPDQQRSALLMRELGGMTYAEVADALGVSVPAVKSLLVRARMGLAQSAEARDAACVDIQEELILAHDRGVRPGGMARRHIRECGGCREFRSELRGTSKQLAALLPAIGPAGLLAKLLGFGGGGSAAASGGAAASGSAAAVGGGSTVAGGTAAGLGVLATGAGHVATLLAAAVVTAGGAVEIQHTIAAPAHHHARHVREGGRTASAAPTEAVVSSAPGTSTRVPSQPAAVGAAPAHPAAVRAHRATATSTLTKATPASASSSGGTGQGATWPGDSNSSGNGSTDPTASSTYGVPADATGSSDPTASGTDGSTNPSGPDSSSAVGTGPGASDPGSTVQSGPDGSGSPPGASPQAGTSGPPAAGSSSGTVTGVPPIKLQ